MAKTAPASAISANSSPRVTVPAPTMAPAKIDGFEVGQREFGVDRFDVVDRVDRAGHVGHVVVLDGQPSPHTR